MHALRYTDLSAFRSGKRFSWRSRKFFLLFCLLLLSLTDRTAVAQGGVLGWFRGEPRNYEECILQNMRGVTSDSAASSIRTACRNREYPDDGPPLAAPTDITNLFPTPQQSPIVQNAVRGDESGWGFNFSVNHSNPAVVITSLRFRWIPPNSGNPVIVDCETFAPAFTVQRVYCQFSPPAGWSWQLINIFGRRRSN